MQSAEPLARISKRGGARPGAGRKSNYLGGGSGGLNGYFTYVLHEVENEQVCKIGIARRPFARLSAHQISNWRRLKFAAVFDCGSNRTAVLLEQYLRTTLRGRQILGEWFDATPERIVAEVLGFAEIHGLTLPRIEVGKYLRPDHEQRTTSKRQQEVGARRAPARVGP